MGKVSQKESVFQAVINVCGTTDGAYTPTKEQRAQIGMILFEAFKAGHIEMDVEKSDTDLKSYCSSVTSNWLRKDIRLNGGVAYVAKNPGSRAGSSDPSLKAMRTLLGTLILDTDKAEVQAHIDARIAEITIAKQAKTVDFSALPTDLQVKFSK